MDNVARGAAGVSESAQLGALTGAVLGGAYQVTHLIGEGGMGAVYEALQLRLNKRVAIKVMSRELASNSEALARFRREAEVTSRLGHPHLVNVMDFGATDSGEPYLVMEYLDGEDLDHRIRRLTRLPLETAVEITRQVASALSAAHDEGIVHRDLKPGNVFLVKVKGEADFVKVLDFGISKIKASRTKLTRASAVMGTPEYMSPEQATGLIEEIDHRADQWALGCIAWEMLSGHAPFIADDMAALFYQVINMDPHPLSRRAPGLPAEVESVLRRALAKQAANRYPLIKDFSRAFETAAFGRSADATPPPVLVPVGSPINGTIGYGETAFQAEPPIELVGLPLHTALRLEDPSGEPDVRVARTARESDHDEPVGAAFLTRIKPVYAIIAVAGVLLLLAAFLLLRSASSHKPQVIPVATPRPPSPAPSMVAPDSTMANPADSRLEAPRAKRSKRSSGTTDMKKPNPFNRDPFDPAPSRPKPKTKTKKNLYDDI